MITRVLMCYSSLIFFSLLIDFTCFLCFQGIPCFLAHILFHFQGFGVFGIDPFFLPSTKKERISGLGAKSERLGNPNLQKKRSLGRFSKAIKAFEVFPLSFPLRIKHMEVWKAYFTLAIIAFGALEFIVPKIFNR